MCSFENANISYHQAAKCRRYGEEVLAFSMELEENLVRACDELQNLTYQPGDYTVFKVWEPKERTVMALPFYDRVIQHMICNVIEPPLKENSIIILTLADQGKECTRQVIPSINGYMKL